ncbi:MAG TPA: hypothetical protein VIS77_15915 [Burkholderiales bacterium]
MFRTLLRGALLALMLVPVAATAQKPADPPGLQVYPGYGRIVWTLPPAFDARFAPARSSAGPRIACSTERVSCEIAVGARDISQDLESRIPELRARMAPELVHAKDPVFRASWFGPGKRVLYTTIEDARAGPAFRFLTVGLAEKGPALVRFWVASQDAVASQEVLRIVESGWAIDAREMWALRLEDYRATCATRFPEFRAANDAAYAASPFAAVDLVQFFISTGPGLTEARVREHLEKVRKGFADSFDREPDARRRAFCEGFPRWVASAARDLQ